MKQNGLILTLMVGLLGFFSCSTDVDLYADYKDVPVVYGMIDVTADTNIIKITKAFCGNNDNPINANEVALMYDSSNYSEKLNAYIVELQSTSGQSYQATGRMFILDTLTIHDKEDGVFYAPNQLLYYTTERFNGNGGGKKYRYRLVVVKPDGDTVTAETTPLGGEDLAIVSAGVTFQSSPADALNKLMFRSSEEGVIYDFKMQFNYREQHVGQEMVRKHVSWSYGAKPLSSYEKVSNTDNAYYHYYSPNTLFNVLAQAIGSDTVWSESHPNVVRYIDDFVVIMSVGGHELYQYYENNNVLESSFSVTNFSNINGGVGLFSSRVVIYNTPRLSSATRRDLFAKKSWGFKED